MLHLHAVPEPNRVTVRSQSFRAMQEVIVRMMLMHLPFEYRHDGHSHIIVTMHGEEAKSLLGAPSFDNVSRIVVEEW
jgi:hypothetical protein